MTIYEMTQKILENPDAIRTANELLRTPGMTWEQVIEMTYVQHFGR